MKSFHFPLCEKKKEIFFQTPLFPPVKSWKMKGLLGINYSQHLADEEDFEDFEKILRILKGFWGFWGLLRILKGLSGINYSQHLADEEDYEDAIPVDKEEGGDISNSVFFYPADFLCSLQVASFWEAQNIIFCSTMFFVGIKYHLQILQTHFLLAKW